jgi:hypothetical protein
MPTRVCLDLTALPYNRTSASGVALAERLKPMPHDRLTRRLQADGSGLRLLDRAMRTRFIRERGSLVPDETVMTTPCASAIGGVAWVCSGHARLLVYRLPFGRSHWIQARNV